MTQRTAGDAIGPVPPAVRKAFGEELLQWFAGNRRDLPWRHDRTPYRVWISELMLQQTRVDQVVPYFERWMRRFPDLETLAAAPVDDVLKIWEGLGYYSRARRAHAVACLLVREHGGSFPQSLEGLRALPGIGPYTAAAVGSLAFGLDAAVVDGNVVRVLARVFADGRDVTKPRARRVFQARADDLLPAGRAALFNEALMELGATVCVPRQPRCEVCPLRKVCGAKLADAVHRFPARKRRPPVPHKHVGAAVIVDARGRHLIAQRHDGGLLGGLWEFPGGKQEPGETIEQCIAREIREELGVEVEVGAHLVTVRHAFSHFTMDLHAYLCRIVRGRPQPLQCADVKWIRPAEFDAFAFGRADLKIIEKLRSGPDVAPPKRRSRRPGPAALA